MTGTNSKIKIVYTLPHSSFSSKHTGSSPSSRHVLVDTSPDIPAPITATRLTGILSSYSVRKYFGSIRMKYEYSAQSVIFVRFITHEKIRIEIKAWKRRDKLLFDSLIKEKLGATRNSKLDTF